MKDSTELCNIDVRKTPFVVFQANPDEYYRMSHQVQKSESVLEKVFFHAKNISLIQKQIISAVRWKSMGKWLIEPQNEQDLLIIMKSIFDQYAEHRSGNIPEQIRELDNKVVDDVVPSILSKLTFHEKYLTDVFGPQQVMDLPQMSSSIGYKSLPTIVRNL